jgi:hypothetical protein
VLTLEENPMRQLTRLPSGWHASCQRRVGCKYFQYQSQAIAAVCVIAHQLLARLLRAWNVSECIVDIIKSSQMVVTGIRRRSQTESAIHDAAAKAVSTDVPRRRKGRAAQPKRSLKQRLVDWVDLPDFLKDNE